MTVRSHSLGKAPGAKGPHSCAPQSTGKTRLVGERKAATAGATTGKRVRTPERVDTALTAAALERQVKSWLLDGDVRQLSSNTLAQRRSVTGKLLWFLQRENLDCDTAALRAFLAYCARGDQGPRWGNPDAKAPGSIRPSTVNAYFRVLRAFFAFLVKDGVLDASPLARIDPPVFRSDQVAPYTPQEVSALLDAARHSRNPLRDEALCLFLLDTGLRASEVCSLLVSDADPDTRRVTVNGKGNKARTVPFAGTVTRAVWRYLNNPAAPKAIDEPLFSTGDGAPLNRYSLREIMERLGRAANVSSPGVHRWRDTFAVEFLRAGGNVFALKELLGHTGLAMTNRYVQFAQADLDQQHRRFSPVERLQRQGIEGRR